MLTATVIERIDASAAEVWSIIGEFSRVDLSGAIRSCVTEGEGVGMTRTITLRNSTIVERLDERDPLRMRMAYSIVNADSALSIRDYSASVHILDDGHGGCTVTWTGTFMPQGMNEDDAIAMVQNVYKTSIARVRESLQG